MTNRLWPADAVTGSPSYSGRAMRQALMAPLLAGATAARPLGAISGVRPGTPDTTVSVAAMVWTIKPHAGVLDLEAALAAGPYGYAIDADVTGAVTAADATYARKDGLYVTLSDPAEADGTATPGVAITYLAGTPAASPVMPATPARSMLLARLDVPKSGSGSPTATWLAPVLALAGGVRHYNSVGELPAGLPASESGIVAVIGSGADYAEYVWDGAKWMPWVTPWQPITPAGGVSASGNPGVRIVGGIATLRGALTGTVAQTTNAQVGTVPSGYRPGNASQCASAVSDDQTGVPMTGWIEATGAIWVRKQTATGACTITLGGLSGYSLD